MNMNLSYDIAADLDTPVSAFLKLRPFRPRFLLESVEQGLRIARYSYIGFGDCTDFASTATDFTSTASAGRGPPTARRCSTRCERRSLARRDRAGGTACRLSQAGSSATRPMTSHARSIRHRGGRVAPCGARRPATWLHARCSVFDHLTRGVTVLHDGSDAEREDLTREIVAALRGPLPTRRGAFHYEPARPSLGRGDFCDSVARVQSHIAAGDVYQLVLSVCFGGECELEPFEVYRALRLLNPSPYMYYVEAGGLTVAGSSPEALVRLSGGRAMLRPIAGTLPRGVDEADDEAQARRLLADPKEGAEHVMLVDLARNDLGRVARAGSVRVDPWRQVERYSHVMHLVSGVDGRACAGAGRLRPFRGGISGRHAGRRAEVERDAHHRRARAGRARPVRRYGRLFRPRRRHGPGNHDPQHGVRRGPLQLPGRRRHRRRQPPGPGARRGDRQERSDASRAGNRGVRPVRTKLLLIDNYDSFTYNLVQAFLVLGAEVHVHRNDRIGLDEAEALEPTHLCISPGPGKPADSGISMRMIDAS
jgi:anthranilate synthase component 1